MGSPGTYIRRRKRRKRRFDIDIAEIRGRFQGELTSRKQLVVRATGKPAGKIRYGKVLIEGGGEVSGDVAALGRPEDA